ncbi:LysR substrate-binding domain-containing protein, partial [Pseudomonas aeruginosa]
SELSIHHLLAPLQRRLREPRRAVLESSSLELSRQLARRGLGVAFQTRLGIEADIAQGELRFLPLKDNGGIHSDLGLYVRTGRYLPVAVDALARQIAEEVRLREREEARLNEA